MANGHGGKRPGAGRPKRPLAEKIIEGYPGKRLPKVLEFTSDAESTELEYPVRLAHTRASPKFQAGEPTSQTVWNETVAFLKTTGCLHLINPLHIERYSLYIARLFEAERLVTNSSIIYDKTLKAGEKIVVVNPAVEASVKYSNLAETVWDKIWTIVKENSEKTYGKTSHDEIMDGLLDFNLK